MNFFVTVSSAAYFDVLSSQIPSWTVTQLESITGNQCMSYTIEDQNGHLVIVDGGWERDASVIREVIRAHNNTVDAWIITHPHKDHFGALKYLLRNYDGTFRINTIYTIPVDEELFHKKEPKDFAKYTEFRSLIAGMNVIYVHENDEYDLFGLRMKVLSAWPDGLRKYRIGVVNSGSMMFRLDGSQTSMLFCADVKKQVERKIIRKHRKELAATYVQCSHHGVDGLSYRFYKRVKAKYAFIDSPQKFLRKKSGRLNAPGLMKSLKKSGTSLLLWNGAGNKVVIY